MSRIVNLTEHELRVGDSVIPPSGSVARCAQTSESAGEFDGIPLQRTTFGSVEGLPDPQDGVLYFVSALVRVAVPHRSDVASPGAPIRDANGVVRGCGHLIVN